jgi:hypothetical protein
LVVVMLSILINIQSSFDATNYIANQNVYHVFLV